MDLRAFARRLLQRARALAASLGVSPFLISGALVALLGWQLAELTWSALPAATPEAPPAMATDGAAPSAPVQKEAPPADRLARLHLFGRPPAPDPVAQASSAPETELDLDLKGIYAAGSGAGMAVIAAGAAGEQVYAVGDTIAGGARITGIFPDRVMLRRGGRAEILRMEGDALTPGAAASAPADSGADEAESRDA